MEGSRLFGSDGDGVIYCQGNLAIIDSQVVDNVGLGVHYTGVEGNSALIQNSEISRNSGGWTGGGVFNAGDMTILDTVISGNVSAYIGGVSNSGQLTMLNSQVFGNEIVSTPWDSGTKGAGIGAVEFEYARGDADQDGDVDLSDFVALKTHFGQSSTEWGEGDFNGDGSVDLNDFVLLKRNFGYETPVAPSAPVDVQAEAVATETAAPTWQPQVVTDRPSRLGGRSVLEAVRARRLGEDGPGVLGVRPLRLAM